MKIEKVNDNQIRCTLTREDLDSRHIKLSELAYGTDKAKSLFREMMQQASFELGFEAEDIPLMIEAIPISSETIILLVTKVEYPEELDTRFSKFSDVADDMDDIYEDIDMTKQAGSANDIIDLFKKTKESVTKTEDKPTSEDVASAIEELNVPVDITKMFLFYSLDDVIRLSHILTGYYQGDNWLYKNEKDGSYYLVISKSQHSPEEFNKVCNILCEYSSQDNFSVGQESYYREHYKLIMAHNALQMLSGI